MQVVENEIMIQMNEKIRDKDAIRNNVERLRSIMELNQNYISSLEENLGQSAETSAMLFTIVSSMEDKIEMNNLRMARLNHDLGSLGTDFKDMFDEYMQAEVQRMVLQENLQQMEGSPTEMEQQMSALKENLNTVYLAMGTKRELISLGVLEKGGLLKAGGVNEDMDRSAFQEIDKREFERLKIGAKAKLITEYPSESHRVINGELYVDDKDKFWSISKFLIVVVD